MGKQPLATNPLGMIVPASLALSPKGDPICKPRYRTRGLDMIECDDGIEGEGPVVWSFFESENRRILLTEVEK